MTRYLSDQNKVVLLHESGTYALQSGTGQWLGEVVSNDILDNEGKLIDRFLGTARRTFDNIVPGPRDVTGTLTFHPQDMRLAFWAIGSTWDSGGATSYGSHLAVDTNTGSWLNPFISGGTGQNMAPICFTLEDSKTSPGTGRNMVRTVHGCVSDVVRIIATQGEKVRVEADYMGQWMDYTSGNSTGITQVAATPFLWNNCILTVSGNVIGTAKEVTLEINNNLVGPHYLNGSRDIDAPIVGNKDYLLTVTFDIQGNNANALYSGLYKQNSSFNTTFEMNGDSAAGSMHAVFFMSGCKIMSFDVPSEIEGAVEATMEIAPRFVVGSAFDPTLKYNPW